MELFKLLGTIAIDNAEANRALGETSNEGQKTESKLSKAFSAIGKGAAVAGKAIAAGLAVGATAMAGLTVKALQASGDLEQNMGGAEAVFGELGKTIGDMKTPMQVFNSETGKMETQMSSLETVSKEAYKNMGLSQSDYLATTNKMGALFKGAGFETQEALDLSSQAMQRAADVASIMGLDTEAAMEAVAGAAKGNFTMMDNLGVAMNDTAIQNYALEKGINKTTAEMTQQEKIGLAMEMFMSKTAYAAGNYAKENETLAGSLGTAKSALTNFLSGSGDVESLVSSFSNLADVIVKNITEIAPRLTTGLTDIINKIVPMLPGLINSLLPVIIQGAITLIEGLVAAFPSIISALMSVLPSLINGIVSIVNALVEALPSIIQALVDALPTIIPALIDGIVSIILTICENFSSIIQPIIDALPGIIISIVEAIVNNLPALIQGIIQLILGIVAAIPQIIQALVDALPTVISLLIQAILNNLPAIIMGLIQVVIGIVQALPQIFMALIQAIPAILSGIWDGLKNVFGGLGDWFKGIFSAAWDGVKGIFSGIGNFFSGVWDGIKNVFSNVGGWFKEKFSQAKENASKAWENTKQVWGKVWDGIKGVFSGIGNWFKDKFSKAKEQAEGAWQKTKNFFSGVWDGIKGVFSGIGNWFKDKFSQAKEQSEGAWKKTKNFFSGVWDGIKGVFSNIGGWFKDKFSQAKEQSEGAWKKTKNFFSGVWDGIKGVFSNVGGWFKDKFTKAKEQSEGAWSKTKGFFGGVWDGIKNVFGNVGGWFKDKFTAAKNGIVNTFSNIKNKFLEVGGNVVSGIWSGISNGFTWIKDKITGWVGNVLDFFKKLLGIKSPSRVFRDEVGAMLAEGVAVGIEENSDKAENAAETMGKNILDAAQKRLDNYKTYNDLTLADEVAFWDSIRQKCAEGTEARISADQKWLDAKKSLYDKALSAEETLRKSLDETKKKVEDHAKSIMDTFGLFDEFEFGEYVSFKELYDSLDSQLSAFELYSNAMESLREKIGDTSLYSKLESMGVSALNEIMTIANLSNIQLEMYVEKYDEVYAMSQKIAEDELAEETFAATQEAWQTFAITCHSLGVDVVTETTVMKEGVTNALDQIREAFESFKPQMKMPHFEFTGKFDIETGEVPTMNVEWYKKAMNNAMVLNKPTIFGYNSATGQLMGGGEAGSEVVAGSNTLMNMIQNAVETQNNGVLNVLTKILNAILLMDENMGGHLRQALEGMGLEVNNREFARLVKAVN